MPGFNIHTFLTRNAFASLPAARRGMWDSVIEDLCAGYCMFPDNYYGDPDAISPYLCFTDGIPFHYPPHEAVEYNNWEVISDGNGVRLRALPLPENPHHRHCRAGFEFYFRNLSDTLRQGNMAEAAKFAGAIGHTLQDNTTPGHGVEGMDGSDIMLFNRYLQPPDDNPSLTPSHILGRQAPVEVEVSPDTPPLPATKVAEASFFFYSRFCETVAHNRFLFLPLLQAGYADDDAEWNRLLKSIYQATIQLNATFLATCHALAESDPATNRKNREPVLLSDLRPSRHTRYASPPYRFSPQVRNHSLDNECRPVPLELELRNGEITTFDHGLGMGAHADFLIEHEIPAEVFTRLEGAVGLHARLGREGRVRLRWELDEEVVWEDTFQDGHLASGFSISIAKGGRLRLHGFALTGRGLDPANHVVLAEPKLCYD